MNMHRVRTIIEKEWAEVFKNRMVIFTIVFMPVIFTVLPLGILLGIGASGGIPEGSMADVPPQFLTTCGDVSAVDCMQIFMMNQFMIMFMMMPLIIPTAIAAYSIVGEKTTRSLEPLLATPITTSELLLGKALSAAVPAVLVTWLCFGAFVLLMPLAGATPALVRYITGPVWLLAILVIGPLMAIASVNVSVMVSSRVNDPRAAEQISGVMVVPMMLVLFGQLAGLVVLNVSFVSLAILVMIALDAVLIYLGTRLFQRETILTRWK